MKDRRKILIVIAAVAVVLVGLAAMKSCFTGHAAMPPLLLVGGGMYKETGERVSDEEVKEGIYLGKVESVRAGESPKENFQTNYEKYANAPVYRVGDDLAVYLEYKEMRWAKFQRLSDE